MSLRSSAWRFASLVALTCLVAAPSACAPASAEEAARSESPLDRDGAYAVIDEARRDVFERQRAHEAIVDRGRDELAQIAPALTDAQVRGYAEAFAALPTSRAAREGYVGAAQRLATALDEVARDPELLRTMLTVERGQVLAAHADLAQTPAAGATIRFVGRALNASATSPYRRLLDDSESRMHLHAMLYWGLPSAVFEALVRSHRPGATAADTARVALARVGADLGGERGAAAPVVAALARYATGSEVFTGSEDVTLGDVPMGDALREVAAIVAIWKAGGSPETRTPASGGNESAQHLRALLTNSPKAIRAVADGANKMKMALGGTESQWLRSLGQSARIVGMGINFALAAYDTAASLSDLDDQSDRVRLVGNAMSLLAATLAFTPAGWAGAALGAAATVIKLYASHLAAREQREQYRAEKSACLATLIDDRDVVAALSEAHPKQLARLGVDLGMAPEGIQWLAARLHRAPSGYDTSFWPGITSDRGNDMRGLTVADQVFHLTPEEDVALLRAVAGPGSADEQRAALWVVLGVLEFQPNASGWREGISRSAALGVLAERAALDLGSGALETQGRTGFSRARSYLAAIPAR